MSVIHVEPYHVLQVSDSRTTEYEGELTFIRHSHLLQNKHYEMVMSEELIVTDGNNQISDRLIGIYNVYN